MIYRNLKFALNSAWQSFWRNLAVSMAAVLSITLILILAGVNLLVGHAFSQVLDGFREKVSEISINVADGTPLQSVYDLQAQLSTDPRVASVKFVTKSEALAQFIQTRANEGLKNLVFLIGGIYGLDDTILRRADHRWSLSQLTLPHQLVRLLLSEQLYRACTILRNEKYHHP